MRRQTSVRAMMLALLLLVSVSVAVFAETVDLTIAGGSGTINDALFIQGVPPGSSGTGVWDSFVRISSNMGVVQGYNTDFRPVQFQENNSPQFTRSLVLSNIPIVEYNGVLYRELLLDINQEGGDESLLSLDKLKLFVSDDPSLTGYNGADFGTDATMVYDMDAGSDSWVEMDNDLMGSGSGSGDITVLFPASWFDGYNCPYGAASCNTYVTLYSLFGENNVNNDGFEEWAVRNLPYVHVTKTAEATKTDKYAWTITKEADATYNLAAGESVTHDYTVAVDQTKTSSYAVSGTITVSVPKGGMTATVTSVTDVLSDGSAATVTCTPALPVELDPEESLTCTYVAVNPTGAANLNTATVMIEENANVPFKATAPVTYATVVDGFATIGVNDTNYPNDDPKWTASGDASWPYEKTFTCPAGPDGYIDGKYSQTFGNTATIKQTGQSDSATVTLNCTYTPPLVPAIKVTKTADQAMVVSGAEVTFTVLVENTGETPVTINSLVDSEFGDIVDPANPKIISTTCALPAMIAVGDDYTCTFKAVVAGTAGSNHTDTVTACDTSFDPDLCASDDESIKIVAAPAIEVLKDADPTELPYPGGKVTFKITVNNIGGGDVTLDTLNDSVYDDLDGQGTCDVTPAVVIPAGGSYQCEFEETVTGGVNSYHTNIVTAKGTGFNGDPVSDTDDAIVHINGMPALEVTKTAMPDQVYAPGENVTFTIVVKNTGDTPISLDSLTDSAFGDLDGKGTCDVDPAVSIPVGGSYSCSFEAFVGGKAGDTHTNVATACDTELDVCDDDDASVEILPPYTPPNVCPAGQYSNEYTDILGIGMGSNSWHSLQKTLTIPNAANVVDLYGQLAAKEQGKANYVRFYYPNNTYVQVNTPTSPAPQHWAVLWYGADLDPAASIRGRWFLQPWGAKQHMPRAFLLYPTYASPDTEYVNVFETLQTSETQVYWDITKGWTPKRVITVDIPAPLGPVTMNVELALVDNDSDVRPVYLTVEAGGVSQTVMPNKPNAGQQLNIHTFTLANVPAGTGQIVITIESPAPYTNGLGKMGGDSAALVGVTANYECVDIAQPPQK